MVRKNGTSGGKINFWKVAIKIFFVIKVIVLFTLSSAYFVVGAVVAGLYLVFYEKLLKTLLVSIELKKKKSPYYYRWKNHHLEVAFEA